MKMEKDFVLITWILVNFFTDAMFVSGTSYIIFWKGFSGWWFLLTIVFCVKPTLFKVLAKRYKV